MDIRHHRSILVACTLVALTLAACPRAQLQQVPLHGLKPIGAAFSLGDTSESENRIESILSDGANRLLVTYTKRDRRNGTTVGDFCRVSSDAGSSFGPERESMRHARLIEGGLATVSSLAARGANIFYQRSSDDGETWTQPARINDEEGSTRTGWGGGGISFVQPTQNDVYCLWTDRRRGFISLFSSASSDGGRTWSPNQAVEYDFREGEQSAPTLLVGAEGRLIAIWIDWRDRKTLADIRSSYSDDGGRHWSASQKVNDDSEHVWQIAPVAVARGNRVFVAFQDFREAGEERDNDWNIYFAASDDNASSWAKNARVNDVQPGVDAEPRLTVDEHGRLCCVWRTGRYSIFGDVASAHSIDHGRTWSPSAILNEGQELMISEPVAVVAVSGGRLLCEWKEIGFDSSKINLAWLDPVTEPAPATRSEASRAMPPDGVSSPTPGEVVFYDDFSAETTGRWQITSGVWTVVSGALIGVEPASQTEFVCYARVEEPEKYVLSGRFKFDPISHFAAQLYFRWDPAKGTYYQITNRFRFGVWMGLRDVAPKDPVSASQFSSRPLVQRRFPFQNNRWYEFSLVVAPERIDYFVDGRLMFSHAERLKLQTGRLGIGGVSQSPTYFDDIAIAKPAIR